MKQKSNAFTLIELIAVLVIMAIIALIVTPLVMNIIRSARVAADKRSVDAYGRSIELAIAGYLLDNGYFPTSIDQLTIEYSGNEVVCSTTQLNSDSSVYLAGCTVAGRSTGDYVYGTEEVITYDVYSVGDHVSYNGVTYYVIEDSDATNDTVKLLKEEPLTYAEMTVLNLTGIIIYEDYRGSNYGTVQYGTSVDYSTSTIKQVVDVWKNSAVKNGDTAIARLITFDDLMDNLGFEYIEKGTSQYYSKTEDTPRWVVLNSHYHATMSPNEDSSAVWYVGDNHGLSYGAPTYSYMIRPVLELNKSAQITKLN